MNMVSKLHPKAIRRALRRFARAEDGGLTVEFALVFPALIFLTLSSFELGMVMLRNAMLDRGVDKAVRAFKIDTSAQIDVNTPRQSICDKAGIIPDCMNQLRIEMRMVDLRAWQDLPATYSCNDRSLTTQPLASFTPGGANDVMILRVCALFDPIFPTTTPFLFHPPEHNGGAYALTASNAFVMEPV